MQHARQPTIIETDHMLQVTAEMSVYNGLKEMCIRDSVCISTAVICYFCPKTEDRLHLSIKNGQVHFILHSVCTIFARNS